MSETNKKAADERVAVFIPRAIGNDEPNLFVSVNGMNFILPKGQTSSVPKFVAGEIERSREAEAALYKKMDSMIAAARR
jgi:hypothetical protein